MRGTWLKRIFIPERLELRIEKGSNPGFHNLEKILEKLFKKCLSVFIHECFENIQRVISFIRQSHYYVLKFFKEDSDRKQPFDWIARKRCIRSLLNLSQSPINLDWICVDLCIMRNIFVLLKPTGSVLNFSSNICL